MIYVVVLLGMGHYAMKFRLYYLNNYCNSVNLLRCFSAKRNSALLLMFRYCDIAVIII